MAREVKVAILGDSKDFARAARETQQEVSRLEGSFNSLAEGANRVGGPSRRAFDDTTEAVRRTGGEAERTTSVFANFAGNAAQDLPGVSGSFGALNVAVGQFAEYATEGGIALKSLAAAVGPILLATVAISQINKGFKAASDAAKAQREQIDALVDGIRDGETAMDSFVRSAKEAGKVEIGGLFGILGDSDITSDLHKLGLSVEQFGQLTQLSADELNAWATEMQAAGADGDALMHVLAGVTIESANMTAAQELAAVTTSVLGVATEETTRELQSASEVVAEHQAAVDELTESMSEYIEEAFASQDAAANWMDALSDLTDSIEENGRTLDLNTEAGRENFQAGRDVTEGLVQLMQARFEESGSLQEAINAGNLYVAQLAEQLRQSGLTEEQVLDYINTLHLTPTEIATNFKASTAEAVRQIQELQRNLAGIAPGQYDITPNLTISGTRAAGGPVAGGSAYLVGERGPELFVPGSDGMIVPNGGGGSLMGSGSTTLVLQVGSQEFARLVVDGLVTYERSNGPIPVSVA